MRISTVAALESMPTGTKLEAIRGRITKVFPQKSGTNDHGEWSMQTVGFQDKTGKIDLMLKDRPELAKNWEGCEVLITAGEHNNKPTGIEIDEYKARRRIKITKSADIGDGQETDAPSQQQQAPQRQQQPPPRQQHPNYAEEERHEQEQSRPQSQRPQQQQQPQQQPAQQQAPAQNAEQQIKRARTQMFEMATLYAMCHDAAVYHAAGVSVRHGHVMPPEAIGALATTFFIEANKSAIKVPGVKFDTLPKPTFHMRELYEGQPQPV